MQIVHLSQFGQVERVVSNGMEYYRITWDDGSIDLLYRVDKYWLSGTGISYYDAQEIGALIEKGE